MMMTSTLRESLAPSGCQGNQLPPELLISEIRADAPIDQLSVHVSIDLLYRVSEMNCSSYYTDRLSRQTPDVDRFQLRSRVRELFSKTL